MKKMIIIAVIFLALVLSSCDIMAKYEITVKNNCGLKIGVYIDQSASQPSAFIELLNGQTQKFTNLTYGKYYIHVKDPTVFSTLDPKYHYWTTMDVTGNETWAVTLYGPSYQVNPTY